MAYQIKPTKEIKETTGMVSIPVARNDGKKGKSGIAVQLPCISDAVLNVFMTNPAGRTFLADAIDSLRAKIASNIYAKGYTTIGSDEVGITALLALAKAEAESQRLTKESIGAWFDADMAPLLIAAIKEKYASSGISEDRIIKIISNFRSGYQVCAARPDNRSLPTAMRNNLLAQFDKFPEGYDNLVANKLLDILPEIEEASVTLEAL